MTHIDSGADFLYGYANGDRLRFANNVEQICAFIMNHSTTTEPVRITTMYDLIEIEASNGVVTFCRDEEFLKNELLPALDRMQRGEIDSKPFIGSFLVNLSPMLVNEEEFLISNVRYRDALHTMTFKDGYPRPYERVTRYFKSEAALCKSYPVSISLEEAIKLATDKGWIH
ncbi:hypothetical protein NDS46_30225 (plasmid) [Paenibacillus thiaminolyticus]|uniref:hypothetical protein n=1 Tax=Paenibacillus thiaminolyticus TaxID=49283 RepID=UPI00232B49CA|nr:hypothetical protein [Paenibacillus thiaminolyticus]WCF11625.1 hypothetical protein NDS46_30225 [Paenibacillus thiaminolyticus]